MRQTWRWFGPDDPVTLSDAREAGAQGIVSALHHVRDGLRWSEDDVAEHRRRIEDAGFEWVVVESVPIHNDVKTRSGNWRERLEDYKTSMRAIGAGANGVGVICYNFIPLVDWVRTELRYRLPSGALALRFDMVDFAAYDIHILRRSGAEGDYDAEIVRAAWKRYSGMDEGRRKELEKIVLAGLPGGMACYSGTDFRREFDRFAELSREDLRQNLSWFLSEILPVAEEFDLKMCIHPDDPPIDLFGLPRVTSSHADLKRIVQSNPSASNGIALCVGSLSASPENDAAAIAGDMGPSIHFAHLRNVRRESGSSFFESDHLDGSADMVGVVAALLQEEDRRKRAGRSDWEIPTRPDHGHLILQDKKLTNINPGYSAVGRLRGLAELRGVVCALQYASAEMGGEACA